MLLLVTALVTGQLAAALQQRSERRVSQTEERFRALIEHSSDVIALLDREGIVSYLLARRAPG